MPVGWRIQVDTCCGHFGVLRSRAELESLWLFLISGVEVAGDLRAPDTSANAQTKYDALCRGFAVLMLLIRRGLLLVIQFGGEPRLVDQLMAVV